MTAPEHAPEHPGEPEGNAARRAALGVEPVSLRTFTPTLAVFSKSAGSCHWTPDGRKLFDYTSGVLVANLGHNPANWLRRYFQYLGYPTALPQAGYVSAAAMTAYNAVTPVEVDATRRLLDTLQSAPGGRRMEQVLWAASGSEAVQKALWAALARDPERAVILATRRGFHGKKGLAHAVSGSETDPDRDPRVRFVAFPTRECDDVSRRGDAFDPAPYAAELDRLWNETGGRVGTFITEPYLGGGGSFHPPPAYLHAVERFCRVRDVVFVLDEVQSNFGRTRELFAFTHYGIEPDVVILGKGLGNGVPAAAAAGRANVFASLGYGAASDTWSGNALAAAAVLATLDSFADGSVLRHAREVSALIEAGLVKLKRFPWVKHVRGEDGGMVWGIEFESPAAANQFVLAAYRGCGGDGVHLLGPLAGTVVRVAPPLTITPDEVRAAGVLLDAAAGSLAAPSPAPASH